MRERGALGRPGGAARELNVEYLVGVLEVLDRGQHRLIEVVPRSQQILERQGTGQRLRAQLNEQTKLRKGLAEQPSRRGAAKLRDQRMQHGHVVAAFEPRREHERATADETQHELEFAGPIGGIDVHQDQAGPRRGEHRQQPFGAVRRPDADALSRLEPTCRHAAREPLDLAIELREGQAHRLLRDRQSQAVRARLYGGLQHFVDGAVKQRQVAGARHKARCGWLSRRMHVLWPVLGGR